MSAPLKAIDGNADLPALMNELAVGARAAARVLSLASPEQKNRALEAMEGAIRKNSAAILAANAEDAAEGRSGGAGWRLGALSLSSKSVPMSQPAPACCA